MNHSDRHLSDQLHRAANDMPDARIDVDAIRQSTTTGRPGGHRDIRTVLLAVAAVVVAIAIPVTAIVVFNNRQSAPAPAAITTTQLPTLPTPTGFPTPTLTTPSPESMVTFSLTDLPKGSAPAIPYYAHGEFYPAGGGAGTPIKLGAQQAVWAFGRYGTGWIAIVQALDVSLETRIYDAQGMKIQAYPSSSLGIAAGQDGSTAASLGLGNLTLVDSRGAVIHTWKMGTSLITPLSVLPDHSVVFRASVGEGYQILRASVDGAVTALAWGQATSVNPQNLDFSFTASCAGVVQMSPEQFRWTACPFLNIGPFSPDGQLVASYIEGGSVTQGNKHYTQYAAVAILDAATGAVKVQFVSANPKLLNRIKSLSWEDDTHLLAMLWSNKTQTWYPVRFGVDGSVERAKTVSLRGSFFPDEPMFESQTPFG